MDFTIAFANHKGGVAKTTSTLAVGGALTEMGRKVLLIDLDPQANLTLALGCRPERLKRSMADVLMGGHPMQFVLLETDVPNLHLAPANHELVLAEQHLVVRDGFEFLLNSALAGLNQYDYALIDCPPALGPLTHCALTASSLLVIPTQCEFFSAHALGPLLGLIRSIRQRTNPQLRYRLLLTMLNRENEIQQTLREQIRGAFKTAVFDTLIEIDPHVSESPLHSLPITAFAPNSQGAEQYRQLAQELTAYARNIAKGSTQAN